MLQVVKSTFIGKLILKYITKKFYATVGGEPHPGQPAGWPGCGSPPTVLPPRNGSELNAENGAPLNADRHSVAALRSAARPDGRVLAPAVRGTGLPVRNKRRPCQIEGSAAATTNILKRKAGSLTLARGWPLASHSLRQQKEGNRPIEERSGWHDKAGFCAQVRRILAQVFQDSLLKCVGFLAQVRRIPCSSA